MAEGSTSLLVWGILGNIISCFVYFAPIPTFLRIYKKRSTEGFQSVPYLVALLSASLWLYYALIQSNTFLLITINSFGCFIEFIYIFMFIAYEPVQAKRLTAKIFLLMNAGLFALVCFLTYYLAQGSDRVVIVGWICSVTSVSVFAAPLCIVVRVIRTSSVEYMPFGLSLTLTLCAVIWYFYGKEKNDNYITVPNIVGMSFGALQMTLYVVYTFCKRKSVKETFPEKVIDIGALSSSEVFPEDVQQNGQNNVVNGTQV